MVRIRFRYRFKYGLEIAFVALGIFILLVNHFLLASAMPLFSPIINLVGGLVAVVPSMLAFYSRYNKKKEIEQQFISFIRDITESINSGMTLPLSLEHSAKKDYRALTPYVRNMAAQVNWGIPFRNVLTIFAKNVDSIPIKRSVRTIIETYRVGGKISDTLNAVGKSLITIDKIKKERAGSVHAQIVTSYLIFFVFIFILIILQTFLIPALTSPDQTNGLPGALGGGFLPTTELYTNSFINFIIIQGFFAGLATGKMAEGSIAAGLKHSILLIAIGYTLFTLVINFEVKFF